MQRIAVWLVMGVIVAASACTEERSIEGGPAAAVQLRFSHTAADRPMELGRLIANPHGEPYTLSAFAYYISNLALVDTNGLVVTLPVTYHLINEQQPASKEQRINVPEGTYRALQFTIGVDSTRNVSGVQSGSLDPANGMFWSWNTGYIFAKMEARSPVSTAPLNNVTYHIGGFRTGENTLQRVELSFPELLQARQGGQPVVLLTANADAWFTGVSEITIAAEAFSMNPGSLAMRISDNYRNMFRVTQVQN